MSSGWRCLTMVMVSASAVVAVRLLGSGLGYPNTNPSPVHACGVGGGHLVRVDFGVGCPRCGSMSSAWRVKVQQRPGAAPPAGPVWRGWRRC